MCLSEIWMTVGHDWLKIGSAVSKTQCNINGFYVLNIKFCIVCTEHVALDFRVYAFCHMMYYQVQL